MTDQLVGLPLATAMLVQAALDAGARIATLEPPFRARLALSHVPTRYVPLLVEEHGFIWGVIEGVTMVMLDAGYAVFVAKNGCNGARGTADDPLPSRGAITVRTPVPAGVPVSIHSVAPVDASVPISVSVVFP